MPNLTTQEAALLATGIAAGTKLLSDALTERGAATRAAHRAVLQPHLGDLARSIHGVVAGAVVAHRRLQDDKTAGNALENSQSAAADLKKHRLEVKYSLPGLQEPLRTLTRAPDWIATYKGDSTGDGFIECLQRLSHRVDVTITRSYRRGRPPTRWEQWRLRQATKRVRSTWEGRFGRDVLVDEHSYDRTDH